MSDKPTKTGQTEWHWYCSTYGQVRQFPAWPPNIRGERWSIVIDPNELPPEYKPEQGDVWAHAIPTGDLQNPAVMVPLRLNAAGAWERCGDVLTLEQFLIQQKEAGTDRGGIYGAKNTDGKLERLEKWR